MREHEIKSNLFCLIQCIKQNKISVSERGIDKKKSTMGEAPETSDFQRTKQISLQVEFNLIFGS